MKLKDTKGFKNEQEFIENRIGKKLIDTSKICAHHLYTLGVRYKMKTRCQHPKHAEQPKQKKGPPTRVASLNLCESISDEYGVVFSVGGVLCTTHYKEGKVGKDVSEEVETDVEEKESESEGNDEEYVADEMVISDDTRSAAETASEHIATCLVTSPVVTLKKKKVEQLSNRTKNNNRTKYYKLKQSLIEKFAEAAAPGQEVTYVVMCVTAFIDQ